MPREPEKALHSLDGKASPAYDAFYVAQNAFVAQSVERVLGKDEVSSSILDKGSSENQASAVKKTRGPFFLPEKNRKRPLFQRFLSENKCGHRAEPFLSENRFLLHVAGRLLAHHLHGHAGIFGKLRGLHRGAAHA